MGKRTPRSVTRKGTWQAGKAAGWGPSGSAPWGPLHGAAGGAGVSGAGEVGALPADTETLESCSRHFPDEAAAHASHRPGDTLSSPSCQGMMTWVPRGYAEVQTLGLRMSSYLEIADVIKSMSHRVKGTSKPMTGVLQRGVETEGRGKAPCDRGGGGPIHQGTPGATGSWTSRKEPPPEPGGGGSPAP